MVDLGRIVTMGWRAAAVLLLLVVTAHAVAPFGEPMERSAGSAFSAVTADVSLKGAPPAVTTRQIAAEPAPLPMISFIDVWHLRRPVAVRLNASNARPDATGPPADETTFSPLTARAPPAA